MSTVHTGYRPAEWFGFPVEDLSETAEKYRAEHLCPFRGDENKGTCVKKTRLLDHPFGVCSVEAGNHGILALCPHRFLEKRLVFRDVAKHYFGSTENLVLFSEVGVPGGKNLGRFDYVLVKHAPLSSRVIDFTIIEFQAAQTTSTGKLVQAIKDYLSKKYNIKEKSYSFGINWADIWKRSLIQALIKGMAGEYWQKALYWVVQDQIYCNLAERYGLPFPDSGIDSSGSKKAIRFALYNLRRTDGRIRLQGPKWLAFSVNDLFHALRHNVPIPHKEQMLEYLQKLLKQMSSPSCLRWP